MFCVWLLMLILRLGLDLDFPLLAYAIIFEELSNFLEKKATSRYLDNTSTLIRYLYHNHRQKS